MTQKPVLLLILDGWGYRSPKTQDNAIEMGHTPNWHELIANNPHCFVETSGLAVGLPEGQMGNSEVGHTNLGAGRVVMQDLPRIDLAIKDGSLAQNATLLELISKLKSNGKACNLMGLMSDGGVHSHQSHLFALCQVLSSHNIPINVHAFMDGRDTPPTSGKDFLAAFENSIKDLKNVKIVTISGRFYGMDRDNRWDRVELAYNTLALGLGKNYANYSEAMSSSYQANINDEFIIPCTIGNYLGMEDGQALLMANFRADRAREILYALADKEFKGFARSKEINFSEVVGLTEYSVDHNRFVKTMFGPESLTNIFGEVIANHNLKQLRIAETEKYAHVTFFFNGGQEETFKGEERILIPSPKVATYDLQPEMSVYEVTQNLVEAISSRKFDVIICNLANGDMVGHTGIMEAALKAVAAVDNCLGKIKDAIANVNGVMLVTADHGNVEKMQDENGNPYTAHTVGKVQAVLVNEHDKIISGLKDGRLADIAPTLLELLNISQPSEMKGESLLIK